MEVNGFMLMKIIKFIKNKRRKVGAWDIFHIKEKYLFLYEENIMNLIIFRYLKKLYKKSN